MITMKANKKTINILSILKVLLSGFLTLAPGSLLTAGEQKVQASQSEADSPISNAFDNNPKTKWSARGKGITITKDLEQLTAVRGVALQFYRSSERKYSFEIHCSKDNKKWTKYVRGASKKKDGMQYFPFKKTANTRYVRITANGSTHHDWNHFSEIKVIIAGGVSASASEPDAPVENAFDRSSKTRLVAPRLARIT